jgi:hypothetical protein
MTKSVVMRSSTLCCTLALLAAAACSTTPSDAGTTGAETTTSGGSTTAGTSGNAGSSTASSTSGTSAGTSTGATAGSTTAGSTTGGCGNAVSDGGAGCCWNQVGGGPCGAVQGGIACCTGFTCGSSNFCVTSPTGSGTTTSTSGGGCAVGDAGDNCDTSTDCNQAENLVCTVTNALFNPPGTGTCEVAVAPLTTCSPATTHCGGATDKPCCGICVSNFCVDQGTQTCSGVNGATCATAADCCSGFKCVGTTCQPTCAAGIQPCDQANGSTDCCTDQGLSCLATQYSDGGDAFYGPSICYYANNGGTATDCSSNKCGPNGDAGECLLGTPCIPTSLSGATTDSCQAAGMVCDQNLSVCRNPSYYETCTPGGPACNQLGGTSANSVVCANLAPLVAGSTPGCFQACQTNADCLVPFHSCDGFNGGNFCYLFSSPACTDYFGTCNAAGTLDGVCIDITFTGQATSGDCIQSAPAGTGATGAACNTNSTRQNPGDCDTADLCAGGICQPICNTSGLDHICPTGTVCTATPTFGTLSSAGTCLVSCDFTVTTGGACVTSDGGVPTKCLPGLFTGTAQADDGTGFCVAEPPTTLALGDSCIGVEPNYADPCGQGAACIGNVISGFTCVQLCTNVGLLCPDGVKTCQSLNGLTETGVCF